MLWPPLLGTSHCGLGHLTMAVNSGERSVWPPGDPPGTCRHLQGHLIVATALGSPQRSHQPQGHVTVGTISMATSSKDMSPPWPQALGTPHHCAYQLLGCTITNISAWGHCIVAMLLPHRPPLGHLSTDATSRDPSPGPSAPGMRHRSPVPSPRTRYHVLSCPPSHLTYFRTLCRPKHWDLGVTWRCGGFHCHHRLLGGEHHSNLPPPTLGGSGDPQGHTSNTISTLVPIAHRKSHHSWYSLGTSPSCCLSLQEKKLGGGK